MQHLVPIKFIRREEENHTHVIVSITSNMAKSRANFLRLKEIPEKRKEVSFSIIKSAKLGEEQFNSTSNEGFLDGSCEGDEWF